MGKKSSLSLRASSTPVRVRLRFYAQFFPNCSSGTFGCMTSTKGLAQKRISTVAEQASVVGDRLCCMEIGGLPAPKVSVSIVPSHVHHRGPLSISLQWRRRDLTIESPATWSLWKSIFPYPVRNQIGNSKKTPFPSRKLCGSPGGSRGAKSCFPEAEREGAWVLYSPGPNPPGLSEFERATGGSALPTIYYTMVYVHA